MLRSSCGSSCSTVNVGEAERILSIGAGAMALLAGLDRRPLGALLCFATGAGLLYRGLSGHCSLYSALEMSTAAEGESTVLEPRQSEARMAPVQGATL